MGNEFSLVLGDDRREAARDALYDENRQKPQPPKTGIYFRAAGEQPKRSLVSNGLEAGTPTDHRLRVDTVVDLPSVGGAAQGEDLSSSDEKPAGAPTAKSASGGQPSAGDPGRDRDMGAALRSVYQRAVDEKVPDDLMDLLGKLG